MLLMLLLQSTLVFANDNPSLYMKDATAKEFRATGTVKAMCEQVKTHPLEPVMDVAVVNSSDEIYFYDPEFGIIPKYLFGVIDRDGNLVVTDDFQRALGTVKIHVIRDSEVLNFIYNDGAKTFGESWVATTKPEISRYYAAQKACRDN